MMGTACSTVSSDDQLSLNAQDEAIREQGFLSGLSLASLPSLPTIHLPDLSIFSFKRKPLEADAELEPVIYWRVIEDDILVVHANSQGCTSRSDFIITVERYQADIFTIQVDRNAADQCDEDIPWGIQLGFGFEELGVPIGGQVVVLNPLDERPWDWNGPPSQTLARR
jgi:hypothetical protein